MLSETERGAIADSLIAARKAAKQTKRPSEIHPDITIEDAYAVSSEVARREMEGGARLIGHKIGLTSKAMQRASNIHEPDYGYLLDTMLVADGAKVRHD